MADQHNKSEVWMRGPIANVPALLQPVAHALLQVEEDIVLYTNDIQEELLFERPEGLASPAFHIQHIAGVIDRMFTYAKGEALTEIQFNYLAQEGQKVDNLKKIDLLKNLHLSIQQAIQQLANTAEDELTAIRHLGRQKIPTTLLGLVFHAAEHSQRHVGQLLVTVKWLTAKAL
ncbi:DinB family protein [Sphingobacterium sp. LRF_L2]|uniref:DinB family protein n=1 Tax=Sphingobacterium sp. LRF_L2 TaxID=3369421 RepID=UPI003F647A82